MRLLKVGDVLEGSAASVDVVVFVLLSGQNFQAHSRLLKVEPPNFRFLNL